ncbi:MAG: phosphate ABC transporter substrate-binding protein PstS, partial [Planctomycetes bacterium]|nr:phosphate ABC transporter substrate-binding protein PstS [Planctomycetota bacterium]
YQAKGSGAGIKDFINKTVDFGASDAAMNAEEIAQVDVGVVLLPMTAGEVVLAYNLPDGPAELKLSREAYTKILMGQITKWNDPVIVKCNDGFAMPTTDITVVVRSDSSGTTYVFSNHLSAISPEWSDKFGTNKTINWPDSDKFVKGPKNDGVTALIKQTPGAIGYIEYGYASQTGTPMATLENKAGEYVKPTLESGQAALANVTDMPEDLIVWLPDPEGDDSYPIVSYTWLLCYKTYEDPQKAGALKEVIKYCLTQGQKVSGELGYIPLPENVVEVVQKAAETIE